MDINSLFGFDRGANKEAADFALQNDGQIQLNPLQRFFGADENDVQNILDSRQQKANDRAYGAAAIDAGLSPYKGGSLSNYGETAQGFAARIKTAKTNKLETERQRLRTEAQQDNATALANATTLKGMDLQAGRDQFNTTLQSQENRFAYQDKQNRLDRGLERELSGNNQSMQLALGQMNADLADKRMEYDRETRRMDKRTAAIAQLMSGLGSLGGAFSL